MFLFAVLFRAGERVKINKLVLPQMPSTFGIGKDIRKSVIPLHIISISHIHTCNSKNFRLFVATPPVISPAGSFYYVTNAL